MLKKESKTVCHRLNDKGVSVYTIISIVGLLAIVFILLLPQVMDIQRKENTEKCIKNMREIENAVRRYMNERRENFSGDASYLNRTGYLRRAIYVCPSGTPESHYDIQGVFETGEIIIRCPMYMEDPDHYFDHVLPSSD